MFRALRTARRAHLLIAAGSAVGLTTVGILAVVTDLLGQLRDWAGTRIEDLVAWVGDLPPETTVRLTLFVVLTLFALFLVARMMKR